MHWEPNVLGKPGNSPKMCKCSAVAPSRGCWHVPGAPTPPEHWGTSELETPRNSSQPRHTNTGQTKWALFWKINIDHIHLYISKHSIRNWTLPLSQALKYSGPKHRLLFSSGVGIPLPLLLLHTIWLPTLGQILHWFMASAVRGTDLQHKSGGQSTRAASPHHLCSCVLVCAGQVWGIYTPHWEQVWTQGTSGQPSKQWDPTPWTRVPVHPETLSNRGVCQPCQQWRLRAVEVPQVGESCWAPWLCHHHGASCLEGWTKGTHWMTKQE